MARFATDPIDEDAYGDRPDEAQDDLEVPEDPDDPGPSDDDQPEEGEAD